MNLLWSVVIVVYPYITGLVAGAFIMASLVKVFHVKALEPIYRLSLLTALTFLMVAPLPLLVHLGHPERCYEVMMTPHVSSPMAIFGFVYAWYLMAVLLLELWFDCIVRRKTQLNAQFDRLGAYLAAQKDKARR